MELDNNQHKIFLEGYKEICNEITKINVLIVGNTGAGKSTLINNLFGKRICEIGKGKPCTQSFELYDNNPYINAYDSKGMEKDINIDDFINGVVSFLKEHNSDENPNNHIYIVLYCIDAVNIQESDIKFLTSIKEHVLHPLLIFTKADIKEDHEIANLKKTALEYKIDENNIFFIASPNHKSYELCSEDIKNGIYKLFDRIIELTPPVQMHALEMAQNIILDKKEKKIKELRNKAYKIVAASAASATAAGAIPIPGPDAAIITPIQVAMIGKLAALYGLNVDECKEMVYPLIAQFAGQAIVRQLLKFIPVAGSVISATVAGSITGGLGYFCIEQFEKYSLAIMRNEPKPEILIDGDIIKKFINIFDEKNKL